MPQIVEVKNCPYTDCGAAVVSCGIGSLANNLGFTDRGILRKGLAADIIVYDLGKLGFLYDSPVYATDFPGGERRLIQKAKGIRYTIINGAITFEESECTGAAPGKLLRSYNMVNQ